jgi:hypothetical protein
MIICKSGGKRDPNIIYAGCAFEESNLERRGVEKPLERYQANLPDGSINFSRQYDLFLLFARFYACIKTCNLLVQ